MATNYFHLGFAASVCNIMSNACMRYSSIDIIGPDNDLDIDLDPPIPYVWIPHDGGGVGTYPCAICIDTVETADGYARLPCGHVFHVVCVDVWKAFDESCPICRWRVAVDPFSPTTSV
jgi:hypothetical protein